MPAYNAEKYIEESICSILDQTYSCFELLIVDDHSTDATLDIIKKYANNDSRIKIFKNTSNLGVAESRNKAIESAIYKYICFLDSDDMWEPQKLEEYKNAFQQGATVLYSYYTRFSNEKKLNEVKCPLTIDYSELLKGNCIGNLTGAYNSEILGKIYQKKIHHEDYLMWLEIVKKAGEAKCIPKSLARYRVESGSLSSNKIKSILWTWNIYKNELNYSYIYSIYLLLSSIKKALFKRF